MADQRLTSVVLEIEKKMLVLAPVTCTRLVFFLHRLSMLVASFLDPSHDVGAVIESAIFRGAQINAAVNSLRVSQLTHISSRGKMHTSAVQEVGPYDLRFPR
jgi:hypothetical protein